MQQQVSHEQRQRGHRAVSLLIAAWLQAGAGWPALPWVPAFPWATAFPCCPQQNDWAQHGFFLSSKHLKWRLSQSGRVMLLDQYMLYACWTWPLADSDLVRPCLLHRVEGAKFSTSYLSPEVHSGFVSEEYNQ